MIKKGREIEGRCYFGGGPGGLSVELTFEQRAL